MGFLAPEINSASVGIRPWQVGFRVDGIPRTQVRWKGNGRVFGDLYNYRVNE